MDASSVYNANENKLSFPGKIALVTTALSVNKEDYHSADRLLAKYGAGKVVHVPWPDNFMAEREQTIDTIAGLAADKEIKVVIINQAIEGTNAGVDKLRGKRDDIFIIYCNTNEDLLEAIARANLIFTSDRPGMGTAMVKQAKKQGAKVFVYYTFPRHMSTPTLSKQREMVKETCAAEGILFVDAAALDPTGEAGLEDAQKFILEDVPKQVALHGEDTAFYSTNCHLQISLIKAIVDNHAIYSQPCCPSPFHGFPQALGIKLGEGRDDLNYIISEVSRIAEEKNMTDRLSSWPVSASMMYAHAGAEYAIKWINGEVSKTGIDSNVLVDCMNAYIEEVVGEESDVLITPLSIDGKTYHNFKLVLMSYLDF